MSASHFACDPSLPETTASTRGQSAGRASRECGDARWWCTCVTPPHETVRKPLVPFGRRRLPRTKKGLAHGTHVRTPSRGIEPPPTPPPETVLSGLLNTIEQTRTAANELSIFRHRRETMRFICIYKCVWCARACAQSKHHT